MKDGDGANRWTEEGLWMLLVECDTNFQGKAGKGGDLGRIVPKKGKSRNNRKRIKRETACWTKETRPSVFNNCTEGRKDQNEWILIGRNDYDGHDVRRLMCTGKNLLF